MQCYLARYQHNTKCSKTWVNDHLRLFLSPMLAFCYINDLWLFCLPLNEKKKLFVKYSSQCFKHRYNNIYRMITLTNVFNAVVVFKHNPGDYFPASKCTFDSITEFHSIFLMCLKKYSLMSTVVNFINIKHTSFSYECRFLRTCH